MLRAATRGSALALWQTRHVAALLGGAGGPRLQEVVVSTVGDRNTATPIHAMGGKGVFVKEVQVALLDGRADIAVHSGKDLPAVTPDELVIAAVLPRADARDALIGQPLAELPVGARVATGSVRRRAQLAWLRPDLVFAELRGNIATRLDRARDHDAIVMAAAAIDRLGLDRIPVDRISPTVMVPQVAQGAVVVECRSDDRATRTALAAIDDPDTRRAVDAERAFLAELGGDCDLPAGAHAITVGEPAADGAVPPIELLAMLSSLDGRVLIREQRRGADPVALGRSVARHLLDDAGGASLLAAVR